MDILLEILAVLKDLTGEALYVGVGIAGMLLLYKLVVVGSVYGVIKYTVFKAYEAYATPRTSIITEEVHSKVQDLLIIDAFDDLMRELYRLRGIRAMGGKGNYIHGRDVDWLREAINAKIAACEKEKDSA